jgi:hypothetical protein
MNKITTVFTWCALWAAALWATLQLVGCNAPVSSYKEQLFCQTPFGVFKGDSDEFQIKREGMNITLTRREDGAQMLTSFANCIMERKPE